MNDQARAKLALWTNQINHARAKLAEDTCTLADQDFYRVTIFTNEELIRKLLSRHRLNRVQEIPQASPNLDLNKARRYFAVKRGDDYYLPCLKDEDAVLPNCFLRSALFSSGDGGEKVDRFKIETQGNVSLELSGLTLSTADKRVYAALLSYYKNKPLGVDSVYAEDYLPLKLSAVAMTAFGSKSSERISAVRESLHRLKVAYLAIRIPGVIELDLPSLIEVRGTEDRGANSRVSFRISSKIAALFGENSWTSLSQESLELTGLASWLATFYSSHSTPHELHVIDDIKRLSGSNSSNSEFKRMLAKSLDKVEELPQKTEDDKLNRARIESYAYNEDRSAVEVSMAAWNKEAKKA